MGEQAGQKRKNIWEDLRQAEIGRFKVIGLRRPEGQHEMQPGDSLGWTAQEHAGALKEAAGEEGPSSGA